MLGGTKVGEGSPAGPGQSSGRGPQKEKPPLPRKLLSFDYLGSFSVNNFEAFCECNEVY